MPPEGAEGLLRAGEGALATEEQDLLRLLCAFTEERLRAAARARQGLRERLAAGDAEAASAELHAFLRECWEALDGLAREANLCMHHLFSSAGLHAPMAMTRQCTLYVVRKKLHDAPATRDHPVSRLLWDRTREAPSEPYERLSFLHNLGLFLPLAPLAQGSRLPGGADVPPVARGVVQRADVPPTDAAEGTEGMLRWVSEFVRECRGELTEALRDATR